LHQQLAALAQYRGEIALRHSSALTPRAMGSM